MNLARGRSSLVSSLGILAALVRCDNQVGELSSEQLDDRLRFQTRRAWGQVKGKQRSSRLHRLSIPRKLNCDEGLPVVILVWLKTRFVVILWKRG